MGKRPRNLLFVSHANPEDNHVSQWVSLQLAREGYRVWCDLTRLLGGEDFWIDIEDAIRSDAGKLIYVLSRASNVKPGPLQELHLGQSVARTHGLNDFVIPLLVDDLPHSEINIQLARTNAIDFRLGWAQGLRSLLEKLARDGIPKDARYSPDSVAMWWQMARETDAKVIKRPDEYLSNWYEIRRMPSTLYVHFMASAQERSWNPRAYPYPIRRVGQHLISFASADDLTKGMPTGVTIRDSEMVPTDQFMKGVHLPIRVASRDANNAVVDLLRQGWERLIESRGMSIHKMGRRYEVGYLKDGKIEKNRVSIATDLGGSRFRSIVGYRSRRDGQGKTWKRFWHFAIGCTPMLRPYIGYRLIPHVLFSDDGREIWDSSSRLHRARRSESRNWWNPEWRDRTLGIVQWLAGDGQDIHISVGSDALLEVEARPISFVSPVSYDEPSRAQRLARDVDNSLELDDEEDSG